jgi:predicted alpha/beta superfamily hydrolase
MTFRKTLTVALSLLAAATVRGQSAPIQSPPALVPQTGRLVDASRGGSAQSFEIASAILKERRRVLVVLPVSYARSASDRRYPVTVMVDGELLLAPVAAVSDELSRNGQIPESVIVAIENTGAVSRLSADDKRVYDLTPPGLSVSGSGLNEGGDLFLDFIEQELLPAVDRRFRTAAPRIFVGVSSGAILATYAAATRPTYCAVVSLDAPIGLGSGWLAQKLMMRIASSGKPVRYASLEAKFGWPEAAWKNLVAAAPASWRLYREHLPLEGHETVSMLGAYLGLRQLFADYSRLAIPQSATASILPYYTTVSASLGAPVLPPLRVLQDVIDDLLGEGRGGAARSAYEMLVRGYGQPANGDALASRIADVERHPPPAESVESLLATPFPSPEEARAFIGEWVGDISMTPDVPHAGGTTLRIRVVDGRVVGETVLRGEAGDEQVMRWDYLKITAEGMTWGRLNGMRPRGVMLFAGKLQGDALSGQAQFGGIVLEHPSPPLYFSFKRSSK